MENILIIVIISVIIGSALFYIHKEKKRGVKCIGCPGGCSSNGCGSCSGCGHNTGV